MRKRAELLLHFCRTVLPVSPVSLCVSELMFTFSAIVLDMCERKRRREDEKQDDFEGGRERMKKEKEK